MKEQSKKGIIKAGWLLFYIYIISLCYFLFFSEYYGRDYISENYRYNLELLKEIKRFIRYREILGLENFVVNILGNILAFAPLGFLLPLLDQKYRKFYRMAILSLLFSLLVEVVQLLLKVGIFDVDDLLLNTLGGMLGYVVCRLYMRLFVRLKRKQKTNRRK